MTIIDISYPIKHGMMVYPGDPEPVISKLKDIDSVDSYNISKIDMCLHTGSHVDVPSHIVRDGKTIGQIELERFCGKCKILDMGDIQAIKAADLKKFDIRKGDRILFKTRNSAYINRGVLIDDYTYLDPSGAQYLANTGIYLVGIDYLSIEGSSSTDFNTHKILLGNDILILESIDLTNVIAGEYFLFAAPINVSESEGAPVRALLLRFPLK